MVDSIDYDLLIVGSGLAGLRAAIAAAKKNCPPPKKKKKKNFVKPPHVMEYLKGEHFVNFNFRQS